MRGSKARALDVVSEAKQRKCHIYTSDDSASLQKIAKNLLLVENLLSEGHGFNSWRGLLFGLEGGRWRDSISSARVDSALNGYMEKSGEGKHEGCATVQDGWPSTLHCTCWLKGHATAPPFWSLRV